MGLAAKLAAQGITNADNTGVTMFISTGYPPLDHALSARWVGGGMPVSRIIEMFGPPSAGKTAISTNVMIGAQRQGGLAIFQDHENSFDEGLAVGFGLDIDPDKWSYNKPDTFESSIDQVETIIKQARSLEFKGGKFVPTGEKPEYPMEVPIVVVFDSLASMVPQSTMTDSKGKEKDTSDRNMNDNTALARATSAHFPRLALLADRGNVCMIFLNQVRTKLGVMYGDPTTTPGGGAPEYYASARVKLGRSMIKSADGKVILGQKIGAEIVKNKVVAPFKKAEWDFLFNPDGSGTFDVIGGTVDALVGLGKIERGGAWTTWDGKKWNSRAQLAHHIETKGQYPDLLALFPLDPE
jgi:RecA/RadA recombinase